MGSFKRIKALIGERETPRELFTNAKFRSVLAQVTQTVLERYHEKTIAIETVWSTKNENDIAYTDNSKIHINLENALTQNLSHNEDRFTVYMGLLGHELGHVLFTDFTDVIKTKDAWDKHTWYPCRPKSRFVDNFERAFFEGKFSPGSLVPIVASIYNILEDRYINARVSREFTGLFKSGIALAQKIQWSDYLSHIPLDQRSLSGCINSMHYMLVNGPHAALLQLYPELQEMFSMPDIRTIDAPIDRAAYGNEMFLLFWPFIEELLQDAESMPQQSGNEGDQSRRSDSGGNGSQQSGSSAEIEKEAQKIQQSSQQGSGKGRTVDKQNQKASSGSHDRNTQSNMGSDQKQESSGAQPANEKNSDSADRSQDNSASGSKEDTSPDKKEEDRSAKEGSSAQNDAASSEAGETLSEDEADSGKNDDKNDGEIEKDNASDVPEDSEYDGKSAADFLDDLLDGYAKEKARTEPEKLRNMENAQHAESVKEADVHKNISYNLHVPVADSVNRDAYRVVYSRIRTASKKLQQDLLDVLEDQNNGTVMNGLLFGNRINPAATAARDGRIFRRKTMPGDEKELAVCLLLDQSGSMSGSRISKCLEMAVLVEDFCRSLDIPLSIVGHRKGLKVEINQFIDFDEINDNAKYKLTTMNAGGCNRDGFALRYCVDKLKERTETSRLMIIVSDGRPNDDNYRGAVAVKDLRDIVSDCKKQNIALIAAAIGDDKEQIREIYGNAFLDISDLQALPRKMVAVIKSFLN